MIVQVAAPWMRDRASGKAGKLDGQASTAGRL
jgi:hypothetical protein